MYTRRIIPKGKLLGRMLSLPAVFLPIGCHVEKKRRCDYTAEYKQLRAKQLFLEEIAFAIMDSEPARFQNVEGILNYYLKEVENKLDGKKYTEYKALLGAWHLEKPDLLMFQQFFALKTLSLWAGLDISEFQTEHLFLHIVETHTKVAAEVLNPINPLYPLYPLYPLFPSIEDKVDSVREFRSNYLTPGPTPGPLFKRKPNPNTHDDTEDEEYTQVLADKLFLVQIGIASSKTKLSTKAMEIYYGEMLRYYQEEVNKKLDGSKATLGEWPLEKAESPAGTAGSDALRVLMTEFQEGFARDTLGEWWNLDTSDFEIERRFLVIRMHHASVVDMVLRNGPKCWRLKLDIRQEVKAVKKELSAGPAPSVPLYMRCKECGEALLGHSAQHATSPEDEDGWDSDC